MWDEWVYINHIILIDFEYNFSYYLKKIRNKKIILMYDSFLIITGFQTSKPLVNGNHGSHG